jgi:glycerol-3-phosphate dehydrogenase
VTGSPHRPPIDGRHFDIVVIGGGINGVAIARECAQAGKRVLLVEKNDFASGTTSRSTRIIHGGLRYLEHGEIGLVRESLHERQRLLCERPHLVRHLNFVLALSQQHSSRSALEIRFGLWLYRKLAGPSLRRLTAREHTRQLEDQLAAGERWSLFQYDDAQCEFPERLVAEWLVEAASAGAVVRNHTEALEIRVRHRRVHSVVLRDRLSESTSEAQTNDYSVTADWVINATGPWVDRVASTAITTEKPMVGGVRGSHLVLRRFPGAPESAVYTEAVDRRPIFLVPWNGQLLFGTTEVRDSSDPDNTAPDAEEVAYLLDSFHRLFPHVELTSADVHFAFAGVRPLPYAPEKSVAGVTRRHIVREHSDDGARGFVSIIGGKLTTAAALARECARLVGIKVEEPPLPVVAVAPANGICSSLDQWARTVSSRTGISEPSTRRIAECHGRRALSVVAMASLDPLLAQPICPHSKHLVAEAIGAVHNEFALTLGDILLRRVPAALGACWSEECSRHAAGVIGMALGWTPAEQQIQLEAFERERRLFLRAMEMPLLTGDVAKRTA